MADKAQLDALRSQAKHLQRRANSKVSRTRTKPDGAELNGTRFDPRRTLGKVKGYTAKQLETYIGELSQFVDRSTQYVGDVNRKPIPVSEWRDYKRAEQTHQKHLNAQLGKVADIPLPGGNETIGQRREKMWDKRRRIAGNPSVTDPYRGPDRKPADIGSRESLKKLTQAEKRKNAKGWDDKRLKQQIGEFSKMINQIGDAELANTVKGLTAGQFRTLWNDTGFATAVSTQYEVSRKHMIDEEDKPWYQQLIHDAFTDARRLATWAKALDL